MSLVLNALRNRQRITAEMNIALAISSIIKVLVPDRDERDLATCHKIHRVVRLLAGVRRASLYGGRAAAGALGVAGKRGVPCGWSCNSCSCPSLVFLLDMIAPSAINTHVHTGAHTHTRTHTLLADATAFAEHAHP